MSLESDQCTLGDLEVKARYMVAPQVLIGEHGRKVELLTETAMIIISERDGYRTVAFNGSVIERFSQETIIRFQRSERECIEALVSV